MSDKTLCIYHGACDDGFAAAWVVRRALGDSVEFYPGVYQQEPPDVRGRDVIMVDFSYKRPVIDAMASACSTLLILDHHATAAADLAGFPDPGTGQYNPSGMLHYQRECNAPIATHALFDMNRSGAGIAWDYFNPGKPRPSFIDYIEDRDLWRKLLPGGDEFTIALRSYPQDLDLWDKLIDEGPRSLIGQGSSIQRYYRVQVEAIKKTAYPATLGGARCNVANAPYAFASEVAGEIITHGAEFGACYFERAPNSWQYSLRSRDGFDVSEIAKQFGGGGHKAAAGFTVPTPAHRVI